MQRLGMFEHMCQNGREAFLTQFNTRRRPHADSHLTATPIVLPALHFRMFSTHYGMAAHKAVAVFTELRLENMPAVRDEVPLHACAHQCALPPGDALNLCDALVMPPPTCMAHMRQPQLPSTNTRGRETTALQRHTCTYAARRPQVGNCFLYCVAVAID